MQLGGATSLQPAVSPRDHAPPSPLYLLFSFGSWSCVHCWRIFSSRLLVLHYSLSLLFCLFVFILSVWLYEIPSELAVCWLRLECYQYRLCSVCWFPVLSCCHLGFLEPSRGLFEAFRFTLPFPFSPLSLPMCDPSQGSSKDLSLSTLLQTLAALADRCSISAKKQWIFWHHATSNLDQSLSGRHISPNVTCLAKKKSK